MEKTDIVSALDQAIEAEEKARTFYLEAADRTEDPGGAAMFRELAEFEEHHREGLRAQRRSLTSEGTWIEYEGRSLPPGSASEARTGNPTGDHADALEALRVAIAAEERAQAEYEGLARVAPDAAGRRMFEKLAEEEAIHRKLLDDQYYALSNQGVWLWGD